MSIRSTFNNPLLAFFKKYYSVPLNPDTNLGHLKKFLVVRQHNQLGDMLAGVSLFRAIKSRYPKATLTLMAGKDNYQGIINNRFIDSIFVFDKSKLLSPSYYFKLKNILKTNYDCVIVPATVSISFTSNLLARLANTKTRIGPASLNGKPNESAFFFDRQVHIDWRKYPDCNVAEHILEIVRPYGIDTREYRTEISLSEKELETASTFIKNEELDKAKLLIGLHVGAGKPQNRWSLLKFSEVIKTLKDKYSCGIYLTGSNSDKKEIDYLFNLLGEPLPVFINRSIPQVAALVSLSNLFITNDTGIMHVAGATGTPQISLFGPTNPFNWAPLGSNKYFIRKSDLIDDIHTEDVLTLCDEILKKY